MSGGKGGSQTSAVQVPDWIKGPSERNLARAEHAASIGYTPYYGPDVAAMTPMQQASMGNTNQAAQAFGMQGVADPMAGMPQAQDYGNGMMGYSSGGMYDQALAELAQRRPAQYMANAGMFIDPMTGDQAVSFGQAGIKVNEQAKISMPTGDGGYQAMPTQSDSGYQAGTGNPFGSNPFEPSSILSSLGSNYQNEGTLQKLARPVAALAGAGANAVLTNQGFVYNQGDDNGGGYYSEAPTNSYSGGRSFDGWGE